MARDMRIERDSLGPMPVPADAYYGPQTARAVENFPISGLRLPRRFLRALGLVKAAAARVNRNLGLLDAERADAIARAATEVADGLWDAQFVVDVFQTGSGTSTNMNANEVIASRAAELLGRDRHDVHPNDHVNMCQSTNDVFPTAIHLAALDALEKLVLPALTELSDAFARRARAFADVVKAGRTHLQDAVPVTLGQEFSGYATVVRFGGDRFRDTRSRLLELAIGGTALGTGLNAHPRFGEMVVAELARLTGLPVRRATNPFEAMQNRDACTDVAAAAKVVATGLMKVANDLRLMASGPHAGLAEIALPAVQPGSSIMPGKVNPVIPEAVTMVAAHVIGNEAAVTVAAMHGTLDLNAMMPVIAHNVLESLEITGRVCRVFATRCIDGIEADEARCREYAERASLVTALAPVIGYEAAAGLYKESLETGVPLRDVIARAEVMDPAELDAILDLRRQTEGGRA